MVGKTKDGGCVVATESQHTRGERGAKLGVGRKNPTNGAVGFSKDGEEKWFSVMWVWRKNLIFAPTNQVNGTSTKQSKAQP